MSLVRGLVRRGEYYDSVSLMLISSEIGKMRDVVLESSIVMGTMANKELLMTAHLYIEDFTSADDNDLLIAIRSNNERDADEAVQRTLKLLASMHQKDDRKGAALPRSLDFALKLLPEANLALISIAGKYAAKEAMRALERGLHVMIFSDNVSIADECALKQYAKERGLLVMGPDCGTAIINGTPLAFANEVERGNIGIVAASGTGLQEVSSIISNLGGGISQAIGTGGRDLCEAVGGTMFIEALNALNRDAASEVIVLISKPPAPSVMKIIRQVTAKINKPLVAIFLGGDMSVFKGTAVTCASTLEEAAFYAVAYAKGETGTNVAAALEVKSAELELIVANESRDKKPAQKFIRALFTGGTLCDEAQRLYLGLKAPINSNTPISGIDQLPDSALSSSHTVIDMGDDEFTVSRPHPMIDYSYRNERLLLEAQDPQVAVMQLDIVLGHGAHLKPQDELVPVIKQIKTRSPEITIVCSITGTRKDPQNLGALWRSLEGAGAQVFNSNAQASRLAFGIIRNLESRL